MSYGRQTDEPKMNPAQNEPKWVLDIEPTSSEWALAVKLTSQKWAQNELWPSNQWAENQLKMSFGRQTNEPKMSSKWARMSSKSAYTWFWAHFWLIGWQPKLILSSFLAHRFDDRSSFWVRFWLIGLTAKAQFELICSVSEAHFGFILGSLGLTTMLILGSSVRRANVVFGSFWTHRLCGLSSFWGRFGLASGRVCAHLGLILGSLAWRQKFTFGTLWVSVLASVCSVGNSVVPPTCTPPPFRSRQAVSLWSTDAWPVVALATS